MNNLHEKISIVSTAPARLFYDKNHGLWEGIQKHYPDVNFYFYHENSFEKKNRGDFIDFEKINIPKNYHVFDLFELYNDLEDFLKTSEFKICDSLEGRDGTNEYWIKNSIYWFRKTPTLLHASNSCNTPLLLYLDADSIITPVGNGYEDEYTINEEYINFALEHDVLSRKRPGLWTETGHMVFNLEKRGKELIEKFYDYYRSGKAFNEKRWDDCWIFDTLTTNLKMNYGSLSTATGAPHNFECIVDHNKGKWVKLRQSVGGIK